MVGPSFPLKTETRKRKTENQDHFMRPRRPAIRWLLALALFLGATALGGWAWWSWGRRPADALSRGRQAYERGDWEEADRLARQRLKAAANDPEGLRLLARASAQQGAR